MSSVLVVYHLRPQPTGLCYQRPVDAVTVIRFQMISSSPSRCFDRNAQYYYAEAPSRWEVYRDAAEARAMFHSGHLR